MQQVFNKGIKPNNYIRRRGVNKFLMSFSFLLSNGNKNNLFWVPTDAEMFILLK